MTPGDFVAWGSRVTHAGCVTQPRDEASKFKVSLEELEASAHVDPDDRVESQPEPGAPEDDDRWRRQQETIRYATG